MPFNAFEATNKRLKKNKPLNEGATGGAAKTPRVGVNKSDLEAQGEKYGWTVRPLTMLEINQMSSAELRWHEQFNAENLENVFTVEENKKNNKQNMAAWNVKRMWGGKASEEETQKAFAAGDRFASNYAQFVRNMDNAQAITSYMEENNLDATQVQSYVEAFEVLAPQGKLVLSPKAAGIGTEETLTGEALRQYSRLHLLCQPNKVLKPEDKLSADQFFAAHPELHESRTPPIIIQKQQVAAATAKHFEQAKSGTAEGQAGRFTDMGGKDYSGYPSHPTKYSFRRLLDSLDSVEYQRRLTQDPTFAKAVDSLNDGNK